MILCHGQQLFEGFSQQTNHTLDIVGGRFFIEDKDMLHSKLNVNVLKTSHYIELA